MHTQSKIQLENLRKPQSKCWFEYHGNESHTSEHAQIWYRSHQKVTILKLQPNDGEDIITQLERFALGHQLIYKVSWEDGFTHDVFEDELLDNKNEFCRPNPPLNPNNP
jgi:hypothetical protein